MADDAGWELYRSFLGVLREGSLSGAARALGITQPTVGRHIAALEAALGLTLFTRSQAGLMPTEAALELRAYAEAMDSNAAALKRAAEGHGEGVVGTVRVSASEVVGVETLPPIVARLRQQHPQLRLELVLTNRVQDLLRREADIAIRMAEPKQEQLIARRVPDVRVGLYAHRRYIAAHGTPRRVDELAQHTLVGFDEETPFLRAARKALPQWTRAAFSLRSDSDLGQLALIRAGCGIGVCQVGIAERDPNLVRVLSRQVEFKLPMWVVMHEDLRGSTRCRSDLRRAGRGVPVGPLRDVYRHAADAQNGPIHRGASHGPGSQGQERRRHRRQSWHRSGGSAGFRRGRRQRLGLRAQVRRGLGDRARARGRRRARLRSGASTWPTERAGRVGGGKCGRSSAASTPWSAT